MDDVPRDRGDQEQVAHRGPGPHHRRSGPPRPPQPAAGTRPADVGAPDLVLVLDTARGPRATDDLRLLQDALGRRVPVRRARTTPGADDLLARLRPTCPVVVTPVDGRQRGATGRLRRTVEALAPTPVVALVAPGDAAAAAVAVDGGARDYVVRHFSPHQMERVLALACGDGRGRDQLRRIDRLWRAVVSRTSDAVFLVASSGEFRVLTPGAAQLFTGQRVPASIAEVLALVHPADRTTLRAAFAGWRRGTGDPVLVRRSVAGEWRSYEAVGVDLRGDPAVDGMVVTVRDVTDAVAARSRALLLRGTDPLTGLPARRHFAEAVSGAAASGAPVLVLLDVDGMTAVNERFGHEAGDALLRDLAQRLLRDLPATALASRVGGDEFAVLVPDPPPGASAEDLARTIVEALSGRAGAGPPAPAPGLPWAPVAAGVAVGGDVEGGQLFANADRALAVARRRGPRSVVRYDSALAARNAERRRLRADLRGAAARGELELRYQPVLLLPGDTLIGFEALVRWRHPELGLLGPDRFVGLGEQSGDIVDVDAWVLRQACTQLAEWGRRHPDRPIGMAVNVSARQLTEPGFAASVAAVLDAVGVVPAHLCLEVTERAVVEDLDAAAAALRLVRTTGVRIAIDDFGIGFSSLAYLQRFPADHIKVDRSFVAGLGADPVDTTLVETIVDMADRLGVAVVAEGVETPGQRSELLRMGCPFAQGFLWARPLGAEGAAALVARAPVAGRRASPWTPARTEGRRQGREGAPRSAGAPVPPGPTAPGDAGDTVAAVLGHELRTPLHVIGSHADLLRTQLAGDHTEAAAAARAAIDAIDRQVGRMDRIVTSLRDARAVDSGAVVLHRRLLDVGATVRSLVADLSTQLGDHDLRVTVAGDPPPVPADPGRLAQILTNLLVNAAKFSPGGTVVDVAVVPAPGGVRVTVVDRGPGIPLWAARDVFRRFVTMDGHHRGSGLGLYLARGFARAHGGDLTYRRAATGGAELCLFLPSGGSPVPDGRDGDGDGDALLPAPLPAPFDRHGDTLRILAAAQQAMAAAVDATGRAAVLQRVVAGLGGRVVDAAHPEPDEVVPVELSLGHGPARFAAAEGLSAARLRLEAVLPVLADFARSLGRTPER